MIMEPCVALKREKKEKKERNICIYLIVYMNFYSFTDLSQGSASQRGGFVCIFLKRCFSTEVAAKT